MSEARLILVGDGNHTDGAFEDLFISFDLKEHVLTPSHGGNPFDLLITDNPARIGNVRVIDAG